MNELQKLEQKANQLRMETINTMCEVGGGHIGGSFSMMDFMVLLYYKYLNIDPRQPHWNERDRVVLSKGHAGLGYSHILADRGYFDKSELSTFNLTGSRLGMHLNDKVPGVDVSTGSLGHGLPVAFGIALGAKTRGDTYRVWCILGDSECNEGSIWEAAMAISHYKLRNLTIIVDRNHLAMDGNTETVMGLEPFADKWKSFGFRVLDVDGHDMNSLDTAFQQALNSNHINDKPVVIMASTIKGKGVSFIEGDYKWHYGNFSEEDRLKAIAELEQKGEHI